MFDFFFLLFFLFLVAVFMRMDWIYYVIYVVGGVWLFSHWWIRRSLLQIEVVRRTPTRSFAGEEISSELVLRNHSRLPVPWLRIQEAVPIELRAAEEYRTVLSVGSRSIVRRQFRLFCHKRGYYRLGPLQLYTGDLFGFVESSWREESPLHITVYPRVMSLPELGLPSRLPFGNLRSQQRLFMDPTRMAGVRPYASGDSMRHIHWRASAREDELLIKKFQPSIALTTMVVLDLEREAYPWNEQYSGSEWAVIIAASLASHVSERRQEVGLISNGLDPRNHQGTPAVPAQSGQGHLMTILEVLARIQMRDQTESENGSGPPAEEGAPHGTLHRWLPGQAARLGWGTTLLLVTPRLTQESLWMLHSFYRKGLNVLVIVCATQSRFSEMQEQARNLGIEAYQIIWDADLVQLQSDEHRQTA